MSHPPLIQKRGHEKEVFTYHTCFQRKTVSSIQCLGYHKRIKFWKSFQNFLIAIICLILETNNFRFPQSVKNPWNSMNLIVSNSIGLDWCIPINWVNKTYKPIDSSLNWTYSNMIQINCFNRRIIQVISTWLKLIKVFQIWFK